MSRSYKKTHYCGDRKNQFSKNYSNRLIRRSKSELPKGAAYKKVFPSYKICECKFFYSSFESYYRSLVECWNERRRQSDPYPNRKEAYRDYVRLCVRK